MLDCSTLDGGEFVSAAPPSYEECVQGRVQISEEDDSQYTQGQLSYAPVYPYYVSLAGLPPSAPADPPPPPPPNAV